MSFEIRVAKREDSKKILEFINMLAVYEKMQDQVVATVEKIESEIFDKKSAEVIFAVEDGKEVGFALYFKNFSTFSSGVAKKTAWDLRSLMTSPGGISFSFNVELSLKL